MPKNSFLKLELIVTFFAIIVALAALFIFVGICFANIWWDFDNLLSALEHAPLTGLLIIIAIALVLSVKLGTDVLVLFYLKIRKKDVNEIHEILTDEVLKQSIFHRNGLEGYSRKSKSGGQSS